ncbi:gamma-glutamylcyclotransferase family protein [Halorientalis salina]|uniref:gamma-glutamylcyclotransferase family protein n=1 Tax=Halorientalis salina TaxID=2932266 RepID=UPI0010AD18FC|nr:gamma-glutamylcyclotransferase family protein [Halorientalis salina]
MDVFVYGTLADPEQADQFLYSFEYVGDVVLSGLHRVAGTYPTLAPGGSVEGRLLRTTDVEMLDRYEGVDRGLYVRVSVPLETDAADDCAAVYVGDPDPLGAPADWPGTGSFADRVRACLDANDVRVVPG